MTSTTSRKLPLFCAVVALLLFSSGVAVHATSLPVDMFHEDFNSYTGFPSSYNDIGGHKTNFGPPIIAEGAHYDWIAARFEAADDDPISHDMSASLKSGIGGSGTSGHPFDNPAGRVSDDAGIVLKLDLSGYIDATLSFDWRTFATETNDRFVVAYYVGDDLGDPTPGGAVFDWFNDPALGNGDMSASDPNGLANTWYVNNWTEVHRGTSPSSFQHESGISLPVGDTIYLAFWLDNGDGDLAKIDNIWVTATIPEPSSMAMMVVGLTGSLTGFRRRRA